MQTTLKVSRYDPESPNEAPHLQQYDLEVEQHFTVLDSLIKVREEIDPSLALRCSCRASICGSCAVRVNGKAHLACKTKITDVSQDGSPVVVEPAGNQKIVKDLVTDQNLFWNKIKSVDPFLQPKGPEPAEEYIASNESMINLTTPMGCIMCGACVSDCTVLEVDKNFLGPAALAKAYRFVADPRDNADNQRLSTLNEYGGAWDCTRCFQCVTVCPKGVAPMDRIMELREHIMDADMPSTVGSRHVESFARSVSRAGWLDETLLAIESMGIFNVPKLIESAPVGIRALIRGKLPKPGPLHHKLAGAENISRIFRRWESEKAASKTIEEVNKND